MKKKLITEKNQAAYREQLKSEEKAPATIEKYLRDLLAFSRWLEGTPVAKKNATEYKRYLLEVLGREAVGVNAVISALNSFFAFMDWDIRLKPYKIQKPTFLPEEKILTKEEYSRLVRAAVNNGNVRLSLVLQAICATGIRVSELKFITVKAIRAGQAEITSKGKTRIVFIPRKLKLLLLTYAMKKGITSGPIFVTKNGNPLHRSNIWAEMKKLSIEAGVDPAKVFPHNLRALFARTFYELDPDLAKLADLLGHTSVNTTRIYLRGSGKEHRRRVEALGLVIT